MVPVSNDYGLYLYVYPADGVHATEIQRADDNGSGGPNVGTAVTIATINPGDRMYADRLPNDGARRHYRIRHVKGDEQASAYTDWVNGIPHVLVPMYPNVPIDPSVPAVQEVTSTTATTGTLTLTITDPQKRLKDVQMRYRQGNAAASGWTDFGVTTPYTLVAPLSEGQVTVIEYQVQYYNEAGSLETIQGSVPLATAITAVLTGAIVSFTVDNKVVISVTGNADAVGHYCTVGIGTSPSAPTVGTNDGFVLTRSGTITTSIICPFGSTAFVRIKAKDASGTLGNEVAIQQKNLAYQRLAIDVTNDVNLGALLFNYDGLPADSRFRYAAVAGGDYTIRPYEGLNGGGLAVESPATNLITDQTIFTLSAGGAAATRTQLTSGEFNGWYKVVVTNTGTNGFIANTQTQVIANGSTVAFGIEFLSMSGLVRPYAQGSTALGPLTNIGNRWWSRIYTNSSGSNKTEGIYFQYSPGTATAVNETFYYRYVQCEASAFSTSYVATTRTNPGGLRLPAELIMGDKWKNFSFFTRAKMNANVPADSTNHIYASTYPAFYIYSTYSGAQEQIGLGMVTGSGGATQTFNVPAGKSRYNWHTIGLDYNGTVWNVYFDGLLLGQYTATTVGVPTNLTIGNLFDTGTYGSFPFNGIFEDTFVMPRVATQAEYLSWTNALGSLVDTYSLNTAAVRSIQGLDIDGIVSANKVTTTSIQDNAISTPKLIAGSVTAGKISVGTLSAIAVDAGTITAGLIRNPGLAYGIRMSNAYSLAGLTNYIDLDPVLSTDYFIFSSGLKVTRAGAAVFSGTVTASTFVSTEAESNFNNSLRLGLSLYANNMKILAYGYFGSTVIVGANEAGIQTERIELLTTRIDFYNANVVVGRHDISVDGVKYALADRQSINPAVGGVGGPGHRMWLSNLTNIGLSSASYGLAWQLDNYSNDTLGGGHQWVFASGQGGAVFHRYGTRAGGWGTWYPIAHTVFSTSAASGSAPHGTIWLQY